MTWDNSSLHQHIPKKSKTSCTGASSLVPLISMGAVCHAYECKYSERNMWSVHFILSIVIRTPLELQLVLKLLKAVFTTFFDIMTDLT